MKSQPILLNSRSECGKSLERIEARAQDDRDEAWLQSLIFEHPEVLPVAYFDEVYSPAIPVGREIETSSGYIDNLYVSPRGGITIVETKLWRNPEKHRTVVAQIIDYAKELSKWNYDQLNAAILKAARDENVEHKRSLEQIISPNLQEIGMTIVDFQERVIATIENGEFLLLIIGDRISPNLALLTESISGVPGLDFRLGLIELQLYPLGENREWPLLVVPDIVGRTVEKTRGVIRVQYVQERPKLEIEIEEIEKPEQPKGKTTQEVFLKKAPDDLSEVYEQWLTIWQEKGLVVYWGVTGFSLRVNVGGKLQTVLDAYPTWAISLVRATDAERLGVSESAYKRYTESVSSVPNAIGLLSAGKKYIKHNSLTADNLMALLQATTELVDSIRP